MGQRVADAAAGAAAGLVATVPMSAVMWVAQQAGLMGQQPPKQITRWQQQRLGVRQSEGTQNQATSVEHLLFGGLAGAGFGLARRLLPARVPQVPAGVLYGLGVWFTSYMGWLPALGVMPPAHRDRPGRPQSMIAAHAVYGAALAAVLRGVRP